MTPTRQDQPRAVVNHERMTPKLQALFAEDTAVNGRRGAEVGNTSERPTPTSSARLDAQRAVERLQGYQDMLITHVLTGGDSVVRTSGWWGVILCPACGSDTLLHDLGEQRVSCTNPECDDEGQPWWDAERWLYGRIAGVDSSAEEGLTIHERQRRMLAEQDGQIAYLKQRLGEAESMLDLHGLTVPEQEAV